MASPVLNERVFAVDPVTESVQPNQPTRQQGQDANSALTVRAVIAVSGLGAVFWYILWKIALSFVAGR
jgi:hypothetical protein